MPTPSSFFSLQVVLDARIAERERRRLALAEVLRRDAGLQCAAEHLQREKTVIDETRLAMQDVQPLDLTRLAETERHRAALDRRLKALTADRTHLAAEIDTRRQMLVEADRQVRLLERLAERRSQQARRDEQRREERALEDWTQRSHGESRSHSV